VYERRSYEDGSEELYLTEQHIYGSARLGMRKPNLLLAKSDEDVEIFEATCLALASMFFMPK